MALEQARELKTTSNEFQNRSGRRTRRQLVRALRQTALLGAALGGAQVFHEHPEFAQQVPAMLANGVNNIHHVADVIGTTIDNIPLLGFFFDKIPHALANAQIDTIPILNKLPQSIVESKVGDYLNEQTLTDVGTFGVGTLASRLIRQNVRENRFERHNAQMGYIPEIGYGIVHGKQEVESSRWAKMLFLGDPRGTAESVLGNPKDKWNTPRIERAVRHTLAQAINADKSSTLMKSLLSPSVLIQASGEATEQILKLAVRHFVSALGAGAAGLFFWLLSHVWTHYDSRKKGTPEMVKISFESAPLNALPGLAALLGPAFMIPAEITHHKFEDKVFSEMIARIGESAERGPKTQAEKDTLAIVRDALNKPITAKQPKDGSEVLPVKSMLNGLDAVIADLGPNHSAEYRSFNQKIHHIEKSLQKDLNGMNKTEKNLISRFNQVKLTYLEWNISRKHKKMFALMQERYEKFDRPYQIAVAFKNIKERLDK